MPYHSQYAGTIADLIGRKSQVDAETARVHGDAAARQAELSGQAWGGAIQNIGNAVSGTLRDYMNYKAQAPQREKEALELKHAKDVDAQQEESQFLASVGRYGQQIAASGYKPDVAAPMFEAIAKRHPEYTQHLQAALRDPQALKAVTDAFIQQMPGYKASGTRQIETVGPDGSPQIQIVPDVAGQTFSKPVDRSKVAEGIVKGIGGYGPVSEAQVDPLMAAPETSGRVRYSFGPGMADGPEVMPTREQQDIIDLRKKVEAMGGLVTPQGSIHMPPQKPVPTVGSFEDFVTKKFGPNPSAEQIAQARQVYSASGRSAASPDGVGDVALSPDAIEEAAHRVRLYGPSSIPTRFNESDKKRILNRSAEINKSIGQTAAAAAMRAAVQKADQTALTQITKQAASAEAFENKALQQADLVKELSSKVARTDVPLINGVLVSGKAAMGDTPAHLLANALLTYTSEYAKIIEGSTGSAAGSSDAARRAAASLISKALSKGTLAATVDQMNREMGMTRTGYRTTIDDITSRMGGMGAAQTSPANEVIEDWVSDGKGGFMKKPKGGA